jgi:hypothetical protein
MPDSKVEITQSGRGGTIYYHEGTRTISFEWEFAASPVLALIYGPSAAVWDQMHVWAAGRQLEIYARVGEEVIRQKAPGYRYEADWANGTITIVPQLKGTRPALVEAQRRKKSVGDERSAAYKRFMAGIPNAYESWGEDQSYDIAAIPKMNAKERKEVFKMLKSRDLTWREVEALAMFPVDESGELIRPGLTHHLSIDTRLAAADALERQGAMADIERFLARQIRALHDPREGLKRALTMAENHPSDTIKQALLWASYNQTECAPHCARLLMKLTNAAREPLSRDYEQMLEELGLHNSYFTRQAAFEKLCDLVQMKFNPAAAEL